MSKQAGNDIFAEKEVYNVVIGGQECGFFLERRDNGRIYLIIPNCGGMADSVPRHPEQLAWVEPRIEKIRGATRNWTTVWIFETPEAVAAVKRMFQRESQLSEKQSSDFY